MKENTLCGLEWDWTKYLMHERVGLLLWWSDTPAYRSFVFGQAIPLNLDSLDAKQAVTHSCCLPRRAVVNEVILNEDWRS